MSVRVCFKCNQELPLNSDYFPQYKYKGQLVLRGVCLACDNKRISAYRLGRKEFNQTWQRDYYQSEERKAYRNTELYQYRKIRTVYKSRYGLSEQECRDIQDLQRGCCAICTCSLEIPHVDHCHTTGKVRGLLCHQCNLVLGMANDSTETLLNAIQYLEDSV